MKIYGLKYMKYRLQILFTVFIICRVFKHEQTIGIRAGRLLGSFISNKDVNANNDCSEKSHFRLLFTTFYGS